MSPAHSTRIRAAIGGLGSRSGLSLDKHRVSKRTQGLRGFGGTDKNHDHRRVEHGSYHGPRKQFNAAPSKGLAERLGYNGAAHAKNTVYNISDSNGKPTAPSPDIDDRKQPVDKPSSRFSNIDSKYSRIHRPNSQPQARQHPIPYQPSRRFGTSLENLQTNPLLCQRRGDRKYHKSAFSFGTVFSTAHHTSAGGPEDPQHTTATRYGHVYSKYRKFVVVECNEASFVALPIYTCNGAGLSRKSSREIPEYMDVMDRRIANPGPTNGVNGRLFCVADGESDDAPVLRDNKDFNRVGAKGNACVHLTEPFSFRYGIWSQIEAQLTPDSVVLFRQVRATKIAASSFKVLQELSPVNLLSILGRMVQANLVEKFAQLQAETLVQMRECKPLLAVDAGQDEERGKCRRSHSRYSA